MAAVVTILSFVVVALVSAMMPTLSLMIGWPQSEIFDACGLAIWDRLCDGIEIYDLYRKILT